MMLPSDVLSVYAQPVCLASHSTQLLRASQPTQQVIDDNWMSSSSVDEARQIPTG